MAANFFTNQGDNTLYRKFGGVFEHMQNIECFKAVIGFFKASGYFAIRAKFPESLTVKIIAGIEVDPLIAVAHQRGLQFSLSHDDTIKEFLKVVQNDILKAPYAKDIEDGIMQLVEDIKSRRIEIRAHKSKQLHSKFYIFLSPNFNEHNPNGLVIMGSSNLSAQGLGLKNADYHYELNIELRDFSNVKFANDEFELLWTQSAEILPIDAPLLISNTYLDVKPTPFEVYVKYLIEYFDSSIDYDLSSFGLDSKKYKELHYQTHAVNQGFELLKRFNGFFLADVVGTGKTVMTALLAKKFIHDNGANTKILVVYPPALESNWKITFKDFHIAKYCDFIPNGSLGKIVNESDLANYDEKEKYDLVLVDEAHKFRNHKSQQFQNLQIVCKSGRANIGGIPGYDKKVVLISATPLNNKPEDIYYLISLFQDIRNSTLPIKNLQKYFYPHSTKYKILVQETPLNLPAIQAIFTDIRDKVLKDITIRRTRTDLIKNEKYAEDLKKQGIFFPKVEEPIANKYTLSQQQANLFLDTVNAITEDKQVGFFRYRAIAYLNDEANNGTYQNAKTISNSLAYIMQTQLIKRLESSFYALKISLQRITESTAIMIDMFERNSIFIAPDLDITDMLNQGKTDEEIELAILKIEDEKPKNRKFQQSDFKAEFIEGLRRDYQLLSELNERWKAIDDNSDPKWNVFYTLLKEEYFNPKKNELGKLVIFTESADTLNYVTTKLKGLTKYKVLSITSENRNKLFETIRENFDANYIKTQKNDFDIIITTDVLAEGVNLHRANVIVNYDTPWNPTKLIQRLGRINRIGSQAKAIYNYNFYPSQQGDERINLHQRSIAKLQSSHSAFGEDNKIYSLEEIIDQFSLFVEKEEEFDIRTIYLEWLRKFKQNNPDWFKRIKQMPQKIRCIRTLPNTDMSIAFIKDGKNKNCFLFKDKNSEYIPFEVAVKIFEATQEEQGVPIIPDKHYKQLNHILNAYENYFLDNPVVFKSKVDYEDPRTRTSLKHLRDWLTESLSTDASIEAAKKLIPLLEDGTYTELANDIFKYRNEKNNSKLEAYIISLGNKYISKVDRPSREENTKFEPEIVISQTFI